MARITCSELVARGDLASRTHDTSTLARISRLLAPRVGDPIADRLYGFARACDFENESIDEWLALRDLVIDRLATAGS